MEKAKCGNQLVLIFILLALTMLPAIVWAKALQEANSLDQRFPVIVQFQSALTEAEYDQLEEQIGAFVLRHGYTIIPGMAAELTIGQIEALSRMPIVRSLEYDRPVRAFLDTAKYWFGVEDAVFESGATGNGITIAIIDTGMDAKHVDLKNGKIIGWMDIIDSRSGPYDDNGHGTHVASIAAGTGYGNPDYTGVAPGASLVGVKALNSEGDGLTSDIVEGIQWCINNKATYDIRIINLSLGVADPFDNYCIGPLPGDEATALTIACETAISNGIVVVIASGDCGPATNTIYAPRSAQNAITVSSMVDLGEDGFYQWFRSSRGESGVTAKPDISAPGYKIMAAKAGSRNGYIEMTGTSMASAFVSGVAALILDMEPGLGPDIVKSQIMSTAQDWGPPGLDIDYGAGRLDAYKAITGNSIDTPDHFYSDIQYLPGSGFSDFWHIEVTDTNYPIAATLIMSDWVDNNYDLDVYLYDPGYDPDNPNQSLVDLSFGSTRQEMLGSYQTVTGTYTLEVRSYSGSGNYFFDLSAGASEPVLEDDDYSLSDIAVTAINSPSPVVQGNLVNVNVRVDNLGTKDVTSAINVTLTDDIDGLVDTKIITNGLAAGAYSILTFDWYPVSTGNHILTASHDFSDDDDTNDSKFTNVTVTDETANVMHVHSIDVVLVQAGSSTSAAATVTIVDASGAPVPGATVECLWTITPYDSHTDSGTTDASGEALLNSNKVKKAAPGTVYTCEVTNVVLTDWIYDEAANEETEDSASIPAAPARAYQNSLEDPFPNPCNPDIWMPFTLSSAENVVINIYDATGGLVRTFNLGHKSPGAYLSKDKAAYWDGNNGSGEQVSSGLYFYTIQAGDFTAAKKMVVAR